VYESKAYWHGCWVETDVMRRRRRRRWRRRQGRAAVCLQLDSPMEGVRLVGRCALVGNKCNEEAWKKARAEP